MKLPFFRRRLMLAAFAFGTAISSAPVLAKGFDGVWSVSFITDDERCPANTIPVRVSDGTVSFSGLGAEATGAVSSTGAIRLKILMSEQVLRVNGKAHGRVASGSWRMTPAGCGGHWNAQIAE